MSLNQVSCSWKKGIESLADLLPLTDPLSKALGDDHHLYLCVAATSEEILG